MIGADYFPVGCQKVSFAETTGIEIAFALDWSCNGSAGLGIKCSQLAVQTLCPGFEFWEVAPSYGQCWASHNASA